MGEHFAVIRRGSALRVGLADISYSDNGLLEYCDPYGCSRARLIDHDYVYIDPVAPIHRPDIITSCLYLDFNEPLVVAEKTTSIWALAPYELVIHIDGTALGYVTPFRVKYTLVGGIIDGTICRYYRAKTALSLNRLEVSHDAIIRIDVSGVKGPVPGIGFNAALITFYLDKEHRIYYPVLIAKREPHHVTARLTETPPLSELSEAWRRIRKLRMAMTLPAFITPASMG